LYLPAYKSLTLVVKICFEVYSFDNLI